MAEVLDQRLEWSAGAMTPPTVRCGAKKYSHLAVDELYRLVASLPLGYPEPIFQLYEPGQTDHRLVGKFISGPSFAEEMLKQHSARIMMQYSRMLDGGAKKDSHTAHAHFYYDEVTMHLTALFPQIFVQGNPARDSLNQCAVYLNRIETESAAAGYSSDETGAPTEIQPAMTYDYQLPNTGTMRYRWTMKADGYAFQCDPRVLAKESMPWTKLTRREEGEMRERMYFKLGFGKGGLKISRNFDTFLKRANTRARGADPDFSQFEVESKHAEYRLKLSEQLDTCIDLSDGTTHWAPNQGPRFACALIEKLKEDARDPDMRFTAACNFLNQFVAKERSPYTNVWLKMQLEDSAAIGCTLRKVPLEAFIKNSGISLEFEPPAEPHNIDRCLRGVKINKETGKYNWIEWYFRYGCREVAGPRFVPLRLGERITDTTHCDYINTFQGFKCQRWMMDDSGLCQRWFEEQTDDFKFLLNHIRNICGGDQEAANIRHAWNALLCYTPCDKPTILFINQGPPGCGKSSWEEAFAKEMLNSAHMRKVCYTQFKC